MQCELLLRPRVPPQPALSLGTGMGQAKPAHVRTFTFLSEASFYIVAILSPKNVRFELICKLILGFFIFTFLSEAAFSGHIKPQKCWIGTHL